MMLPTTTMRDRLELSKRNKSTCHLFLSSGAEFNHVIIEDLNDQVLYFTLESGEIVYVAIDHIIAFVRNPKIKGE